MASLLLIALAALAFVHFREQPPVERTLRYNIPVRKTAPFTASPSLQMGA
jgi:hypothetical protein